MQTLKPVPFEHSYTIKPATTKLAFYSNETSKDKLSIIENWLSIIVIQVHAKLHKTCSFLHAHLTETLKVVEKFVKTCFMVKNTHLLNGHML